MKAMPYERKKSLVGLGFISPWLIGVIWFFLYPMVYAVIYVFYDVSILDNGLGYTYVGGDNLRYIFLEDPDNIRLIVSSFLQTLGEVVLIVAFSLFLAILLNQRFRGRAFSRAVFALPILVSSGILLTVFKNDLFLSSVNAGVESTIFQSAALEMSLMRLGLSPALVETVSGIASGILDLIWKAGMQILLFLAGIQSIPGSLYEVCSMEGATAWQTFWKVTFPLMSPFIVLNIIYSIIDAFTYYTNPVMAKAQTYFVQTAYSYNATLVLMYSLFVLALTGLVMAFLSKKVHYVEK